MKTRNRRVLASTVTAAVLAAVVAGVAAAQPTTDDSTQVEEQEPMLNSSVSPSSRGRRLVSPNPQRGSALLGAPDLNSFRRYQLPP